MKYWFFDGNDVVGPFAPEELAARLDFSANSLICAEESSEDAAGWQMASSFDAFRFNPVTRKIESIATTVHTTVPPSDSPFPQTPAENNSVTMQKADEQPLAGPFKELSLEKQKSAPIPLQENAEPRRYQENLPFVRLSKVKSLRPSYSPVALASANVDLVLPENKTAHAKSKPKTDTPGSSVCAKSEADPPKLETDKPVCATGALSPITKEPALETKQVSTITLPIVNEILAQSDLPKLPEQNYSAVELPTEPNFEIRSLEQSQEEIPPFPLDGFAALSEDTSQGDLPAPQVPDTFENLSKNDSIFNPSQTEILHRNERKESDFGSVEEMVPQATFLEGPSHQRARKVLFFFLALVVLGACCYGGIRYYRQALEVKIKSAETELLGPVTMPKPLSVPTPTQKPVVMQNPVISTPTPVASPKSQTSSDRALAIVQTYQLSGNRGTVASYFDRLYQEQLSDGYTAEWSVEPLHKNIYIVKYRLAKTRTEPIVYVFQADISHNRLTGALNNITLDLLGKI